MKNMNTEQTDKGNSEEIEGAGQHTEAEAVRQEQGEQRTPDKESGKTDVGNGQVEEQAADPEITVEDFWELQEAYNRLEEEFEALKEKQLRQAAELENYKKRTEREFTRRVQFANKNLFREILPILDDLERTVDAATDESSFERVEQGIKLVYNNFLNILEKRGIEPIDAVGEPFDPELHEAMMVQESEEHDPDTVIEEYERGYRIGETVLRHAKVVVSR